MYFFQKPLLFLTVFGFLFLSACKPSVDKQAAIEEIEVQPEAAIAYAKFRASVRKDKELKDWLANINKGESVNILQETEETDKKGKKRMVAYIELADGKKGYITRSWLGGTPFVALDNIRVFDKPDYASRVRATLKKGDIVFLEQENDAGNWFKIWAGKIDGVWITSHWIEKSSNLSDATNAVIDARDYQEALSLLEENKTEEALKKLQALAEFGNSEFAEIGKQKLQEMVSGTQSGDPQNGEDETDFSDNLQSPATDNATEVEQTQTSAPTQNSKL